MEKMTFEQARTKIIDAYFRDEIKPFDAQFCFCGTLSPDRNWYMQEYPNEGNRYNYSVNEYGRLEAALFSVFPKVTHSGTAGLVNYRGEPDTYIKQLGSRYEDILFAGMSAALDVLKTIHEERGEIIDPTPVFSKREVVTVK